MNLGSGVSARVVPALTLFLEIPAAEQADRSWEYINRSQTHECGNWD
jgi:hypothetical protein